MLVILLACSGGDAEVDTGPSAGDTSPPVDTASGDSGDSGGDTGPDSGDSGDTGPDSGDSGDSAETGDSGSGDTDSGGDSADTGPSSWIEAYVADGKALSVAEISQNLSGVTWNAAAGVFVAALDNSRKVAILDADFNWVSEIELENVDHADTEDIVWLGSTKDMHSYAIVTEDNTMYVGEVSHDASETDLDTWQLLTFADDPDYHNQGAEGVGWDAATGTLYACNEKNPLAVQAFSRPKGTEDATWEKGLTVTEPFDAEDLLGDLIGDISSCAFHADTGRLLILSHEDRVLLDVGLDGTVHGQLEVSLSAAGSSKPEGFAFDDDGRLLIVGEPDAYAFYAVP